MCHEARAIKFPPFTRHSGLGVHESGLVGFHQKTGMIKAHTSPLLPPMKEKDFSIQPGITWIVSFHRLGIRNLIGNGSNTVSESTVSNTELGEPSSGEKAQ